MKRSFLATLSLVALVAMIMASSVSAQTTYLSENFDAVAGGTTPPAGWTAFIAPAATGSAIWRWDNPGGRTFGGALAGGVAIADSDNAGGIGHDTTLQSPDINVTPAATLILEWDHHLRPLSGTTATVQVFDGAVYNVVFTQSGGTNIGSLTAPVRESFDVTALAGGSNAANIQFQYQAGFDWYWAVDNVDLFEPAAYDLANAGITAPSIDPNACIHSLTATETVSFDVLNNGGNAFNITDSFRVFVDFDAVNVLIENVVFPAPLAPGATMNFSTTGTVDMSATGSHSLTVRLVLLTQADSDTTNDNVTINYTSPGATPVGFGYFENFDSLPSNNGSFSMTVFDVPTGWVNAQDDAASLLGNAEPDWGPNHGTTGSAGGIAGPDGDHTQGPGSPGIYMYIEDSPSQVGDIELRSPCLDTSGAVGTPTIGFWHHSRPAAGAPNDNVIEVDIIDETNGGVVTMSVLSVPGNGAAGWFNASVDVSAFAPSLIRVQFRTNNNNGTFTDDLAIDDFSFADVVAASGQAPRPGMSVFDMNNAVNGNLQAVASGANGPYFTSVTQGSALNMTWEGIPNQPLTCVIGNLNVQSATYAGGIGQFDIGGPGVDMAGLPLGIAALFDGITYYNNPTGYSFDAFFVVGPAGTGGVSLTMPVFGLAPGTVLTTFQCVMSDSVAPFFYISNAIELTVN